MSEIEKRYLIISLGILVVLWLIGINLPEESLPNWMPF